MFTDYEVLLGCSDNTNCVKAESYYIQSSSKRTSFLKIVCDYTKYTRTGLSTLLSFSSRWGHTILATIL